MEKIEGSEQNRFSRLESLEFLGEQMKAEIILAAKGLKPAVELELYFEPNNKSYTVQEFEKDVKELKEVLNSFGLSFESERDESDLGMYSEHFYISKDKKLIQELKESDNIEDGAERDRVRGKLLGIPQTAIEAFISNTSIDKEELPEEAKNMPGYRILSFRPSKDHWREELQDLRKLEEGLSVEDSDE